MFQKFKSRERIAWLVLPSHREVGVHPTAVASRISFSLERADERTRTVLLLKPHQALERLGRLYLNTY